MYTSHSKTAGQGWALFLFAAIAVALMVVSSGLVCLAQKHLPDVKDPFPDKTSKVKPTPTPRKSPTPTPDKTVAPVAPGGAYGSYSGSELVAPGWEMRNPDPIRWTMQPRQKSLLIQTQTGTLSDSKNLKNWLMLNKDLPVDDFEVVVEASIQIQGIGNQVVIALFVDDQNYFAVTFQGGNYYGGIKRVPYFGKRFQGKDITYFGGGTKGDGPARQPERIFLKIDREGSQYSGSYAFVDQPATIDQIKWEKMGTLPWINFRGRLVLYAANYQDAPEVAAEFYSVLIRKK